MKIRAYLGFIPIAVVGLPFLVAVVRQALFYKGCMDGFGYMLVAMFAFVVGGALNIVYLLFAAITYRSLFQFPCRRERMAAKAAFFGSVALLIVQVIVVAHIVWVRMTGR